MNAPICKICGKPITPDQPSVFHCSATTLGEGIHPITSDGLDSFHADCIISEEPDDTEWLTFHAVFGKVGKP